MQAMSQTLSASTLLIVPLAPLAGSLIAGILGTAFGGNRIGRTASHSVTILGVLIAFIVSAFVLRDVVNGASFNATLYEWMTVGKLKMEIGFLIDSPTLAKQFVHVMDTEVPTLSYRVELNGNGDLQWVGGSNTSAPQIYTVEPHTTWFSRTMVRVLGWLPIEGLL